MLYEEPSRADGYFRDACVFRDEIDIPDTMSAAIRYANGVQVSCSLNTFMPIEGYHLAFNGSAADSRSASTNGRPGSRRRRRILVLEISEQPRGCGWRIGRGAISAAKSLQQMLFAPHSD